MRLFIAIDFNGLDGYLSGLQKRLPQNTKLSLVRSFHLTLKFLGDVRPHKVDEIIESLRKIKFEKFSVSLDSIGIFPTEEYIKVVWIGLKPEDAVIKLQKQVDNSLEKLFRKEKDFKAHITLARVRLPIDNKPFVEEIKGIKVENKRLTVNDFRLMKSTLDYHGPVYKDVEVFSST